MKSYFSKAELILWGSSMLLIIGSFCLFDRENPLTLLASVIGVTSLIFNAKGNPVGQALMILFSLLYGFISYRFGYYGEMITYLGMTLPMAVVALVSWLRHPYRGKRSEVAVKGVTLREVIPMCAYALLVSVLFYFVLAYFQTVNVIPSTLSVTTSFIAVYLTFKRSPLFALAYAANDAVLIVLWTLAGVRELRYISVVVCFVAFFANDLYGYISWQKMKRRQLQNG